MNHTDSLGFPEAARRLGVPVRVLRRAIRAGRVPAPPHVTATATLSPAWFESVEAKVVEDPKALSRTATQKVPPFARYRGTSAWTKYLRRVRDYARFRANAAHES